MKKYSSTLHTTVLLVAFVFILGGCSSKTQVISTPGKHQINKKGPYQTTKRVKGTQRPYKIKGKTYYPLPSAEGFNQTGTASWYGKPFHGRKTSNGETYNMYSRTAAHKTLPMNTHLLVENLDNGKEIVVRVNDRGPFVRGRIIDLSYTGAKELGVITKGTARVRISALGEAIRVEEKGKQVERFLPHKDFSKGKFYVQIGSFTLRSNAERLQKSIRKTGRSVTISPFDRTGTVFYRVQVKAGEDLNRAQEVVKTLRTMGYEGAFLAAK
jgi:rare lipoprotein A